MISKVILVLAIAGYQKGGLDHIEFKNMTQCREFKNTLDREHDYKNTNRVFKRFDIESLCVEVSE